MRWASRARAAVAALAVLGALLLPLGAYAQTGETSTGTSGETSAVERQRDIEARVRELQAAIGEASAEEAALIEKLTETQSQLDEFDETIASIDAELGAANSRLGQAQGEVTRLDARYIALTRQLSDAQRAIDIAEDDAADIAAELYRRAGGGQVAALTSLALDAKTPADLFAGRQYLTTAAADTNEKIDALEGLKRRVDRVRDVLEEQREEAKAARDVVAREQAEIAALHQQQAAAREQVAVTVQRQQSLVNELHAQQHRYSAELAALQAESDSIAGMLRSRQSSQALVPSGSGILAIPVNAPITSGFGQRTHPILGTTRMHNGIDLGAGYGTPIRAAADGQVVWAGPRGGYGNTVIIDHGNALATLYAHQSSVSVGVGQAVSRGQTVGAVGSTGLSTGPHLHFEVRVRGTPTDPLQYL